MIIAKRGTSVSGAQPRQRPHQINQRTRAHGEARDVRILPPAVRTAKVEHNDRLGANPEESTKVRNWIIERRGNLTRMPKTTGTIPGRKSDVANGMVRATNVIHAIAIIATAAARGEAMAGGSGAGSAAQAGAGTGGLTIERNAARTIGTTEIAATATAAAAEREEDLALGEGRGRKMTEGRSRQKKLGRHPRRPRPQPRVIAKSSRQSSQGGRVVCISLLSK